MSATDGTDEVVEAAIRFSQAQLATGEFPHTQALFGMPGGFLSVMPP